MKHLREKIIEFIMNLFQSLIETVKEQWRKNSESVDQSFKEISSSVFGYEAYDQMEQACQNRNAALAKELASNLVRSSIRFIQKASIPSHRDANNALWYHTKQFSRFVEFLDISNEVDYSRLLQEYHLLRLHLQDMIFYELKMKLRLGQDRNDLSFWITHYTPTPA